MVEQSTGLKDLKFETEPGPSEREMQPVMDAHGRIAGFFTWDKSPSDDAGDEPADAGHRRHRHRAGGLCRIFALAAAARAARTGGERGSRRARAADEDKLTGLPNHAKTLELLDLALAERAGDEVTTFALIELDGMADVNAHLGVLGSDELIVAVAKRLKEALPAEAICGRIGSDEFAVTLTAAAAMSMPRRSSAPPSRPSRARIGSIPWCGSARMPASRRRRATPPPAAS